MKRREFLQTAAVAPLALALPVSLPVVSPKPQVPSHSIRPASTFPSGPGRNHGVNKEAGLHIEGIGWVPNIPWHYIRIPAENGWPPMLKLRFAAKRSVLMFLSHNLQDWATPTPFERDNGRQDYLAQNRIITLWDFKHNRQECIEDVYPIALQIIHGNDDWSNLEMDLFHGEIVDRYNKDSFLFFLHMTQTL